MMLANGGEALCGPRARPSVRRPTALFAELRRIRSIICGAFCR
jgi:hypothetical protein